MTAIFTLLWLLCIHLLLVALLAPSAWLYQWLVISLESGLWLFLLLLPISLFFGILAMLLLVSLFYRALPPTPQGRFTMFADSGAILWAINNAPATLVLKWFQSTLFLNDPLRFLVLRALACNIKASSWVTSNTQLSDLRNIYIGENSLIGEHCSLCPSLQTQRNRLRIANIVIGNNVLLGYECVVGPGTQIADGTSLDVAVRLYGYSSIGRDCHLGMHTVVEPGCRIGDRVRIGRHCLIRSRARISADATIPDGTVVTGQWPLTTSDKNNNQNHK